VLDTPRGVGEGRDFLGFNRQQISGRFVLCVAILFPFRKLCRPFEMGETREIENTRRESQVLDSIVEIIF